MGKDTETRIKEEAKKNHIYIYDLLGKKIRGGEETKI